MSHKCKSVLMELVYGVAHNCNFLYLGSDSIHYKISPVDYQLEEYESPLTWPESIPGKVNNACRHIKKTSGCSVTLFRLNILCRRTVLYHSHVFTI